MYVFLVIVDLKNPGFDLIFAANAGKQMRHNHRTQGGGDGKADA
jgi:hypothetical protein